MQHGGHYHENVTNNMVHTHATLTLTMAVMAQSLPDPCSGVLEFVRSLNFTQIIHRPS